ncbi:MAG: class I SAM-dependent methyltransferase [Polyangiales bacterium]
MSSEKAHSERYFTDSRDHWWNSDYLGLLARRLDVASARTILEVGTGQGHFARAFLPHFSPGFSFTGVDREERSLAVARERCPELTFLRADAEQLPFADESFDLVMCQTLLMHLRDPQRGFDEMVRVCKRGGLVLAVEPNNLAGFQRFAAYGPQADPAAHVAEILFLLTIIRGKNALGLGWNNFGVHLPKYFRVLRDVRYYNNDRPWILTPPYESPQERALLADIERAVAEGVYGWERGEARNYYVAGGGDEARFDAEYDAMLEAQRDMLDRCKRGEWTELTAFAGLIAAGRKP